MLALQAGCIGTWAPQVKGGENLNRELNVILGRMWAKGGGLSTLVYSVGRMSVTKSSSFETCVLDILLLPNTSVPDGIELAIMTSVFGVI